MLSATRLDDMMASLGRGWTKLDELAALGNRRALEEAFGQFDGLLAKACQLDNDIRAANGRPLFVPTYHANKERAA